MTATPAPVCRPAGLVEPDEKTAGQIKETLAGFKIDLPILAYR